MALRLASSRSAPRARATPMRRSPCTSGLPKRRIVVSGSARALRQDFVARGRGIALGQDDAGGGRPVLADGRDGQAENGPDVQGEFGKILGNERDHARVVGAGRHFREEHLVPFHEQFHAENAASAQGRW